MSPIRLYLGLVAFGLAGSAFSRFTGLNPGPIAPLVSAGTLLTGLFATFSPWFFDERSGMSRSKAVALCSALALGAASEILGITTGFPFGRYVYTDRWWPTVPLTTDSRFPLLLPFAWLLVAGGSWLAVPGKGFMRIALGATLAALLDMVMEPVMAGPLDYWRWQDHGPLPGGAPILNSVGWFVVSALAGTLLELANREDRPWPNSRIVLAAHTVLIVGLGTILGG